MATVDAEPPLHLAATLSTSQTTFFRYGEINYNRPSRPGQTQLDVRRAIICTPIKPASARASSGEFEFEHSVTSADDAGVKWRRTAFYVEHRLTG